MPTLRGRTVVTLFYESSTRTSSSFELAAKRLSADLVSVKAAGSSVDKGESLKDTVATLSAYDPAAIVIRHPYAGAAQMVAGWTAAAVVNAGDGKHEHPSQALLDVYTLRRRLGSLEGKQIWIVGDVLHSRVARSNLIAFQRMGAEVTLCGPPTLIPRGIEELGCEVTHSLDGLEEADVVYALRMQLERMDDKLRPQPARVRRDLPDRHPPARPAPAADAPRPGQPRGRDLRRGDRLAAVADHRAGRRRPGGADGDPLRAARRPPGAPDRDRRRRRRGSRRADDRTARVSAAENLTELLDVRAGAPADLVLRRATLLDPVAGIDGVHDLVIRDGRIAELAAPGEADATDAEELDAEGLHAFPAFFDPHVHLRTPGQEHKEDVETGTRAAAAGGYCGIIAMANTSPPISTAADITALREQARAEASVPVGFTATVTVGMKGEELTEMVELREAGAIAFTDDGLPIRSARVMRRALQYQRLCGGTIALHEEDPDLSGRRRHARRPGLGRARARPAGPRSRSRR